jgi:hypothetical protein
MVPSHLYAGRFKNHRVKTKIGIDLSSRYDELRQTVKGKDALIRILFKATRLLYREPVKELTR